MPSESEQDLYEIFELPFECSQDDVRSAYKKLSLKHHPDKNLDDPEAATAKMILINNAYEILKDEEKRHEYDVTYKKFRNPEERENDRTDHSRDDGDSKWSLARSRNASYAHSTNEDRKAKGQDQGRRRQHSDTRHSSRESASNTGNYQPKAQQQETKAQQQQSKERQQETKAQQQETKAKSNAREATDARIYWDFHASYKWKPSLYDFDQRIAPLKDYIVKLWNEFQAEIASLRQQDERAIDKACSWTPLQSAVFHIRNSPLSEDGGFQARIDQRDLAFQKLVAQLDSLDQLESEKLDSWELCFCPEFVGSPIANKPWQWHRLAAERSDVDAFRARLDIGRLQEAAAISNRQERYHAAYMDARMRDFRSRPPPMTSSGPEAGDSSSSPSLEIINPLDEIL